MQVTHHDNKYDYSYKVCTSQVGIWSRGEDTRLRYWQPNSSFLLMWATGGSLGRLENWKLEMRCWNSLVWRAVVPLPTMALKPLAML